MTAAANQWVIGSEGVGPIRLGGAVPQALLTADLDQHYVARYIADGQPFEGYRFEDPPLTVAIAGGPFARFSEKEAVDKVDPSRFRAAAGKQTRAGAKVQMIIVHGAGPATAAGIGVGSDLAALRTAYPDIKLHSVPETFGNDEAVARSPTLKNVHFVFRSRKAAEAGDKILRIDLWRD
ncbi:MAG: hypothetical protein RMK29_16025 [Myxococcales bacterium]|nr:hypothetical protein [Myxococcota bacterium]MDW8283225.1 hypothetical protein [Myxococcales bacterium]